MNHDLSKEKATAILKTLSPMQQEVLIKQRRYLVQPLPYHDDYFDEEQWQFWDVKIDHHFPIDDLRCACGRQIRHQFILKDKKTGEFLKLGTSHFQQRLEVPTKDAKQIIESVYAIDWEVEVVLKKITIGLHFPNKFYQALLDQGYESYLPQKICARLKAFQKANLPIFPKDQETLCTLMPTEPENTQNQSITCNYRSKQLKENPIKQLIKEITFYEVDEYLDSKKLAKKIKEPEQNIIRWLSLLQSDRYLIRTKLVGKTFYRIK